MTIHVTVAVVAANLPPLEPPVGDNGFDVPYRDRLKVALTVDPEETLASVYQRTIDKLQPEIRFGPSFPEESFRGALVDVVQWAWFYEPADEHGISDHKVWEVASQLITVGEDGLAAWGREARDIPYADLVRAGDAGLLRGDALRPYVAFLLPQFDGGALQLAWDTFRTTLEIVGDVLTVREVTRLAAGISRRRLERKLEAGRVIALHQDQWVRRRGGPRGIQQTVDRRPWTGDDLRILLGLSSDEEAKDLLALFGVRPDDTGRFDVSEEVELALLSAITEAASRGDLDPSDAQTRQRIEEALETGALPPRSWKLD